MFDMHMPVPQQELESFFFKFDRDHDRRISFNEFRQIVRKKGFWPKFNVHVRAFFSFAAVALFWNGLYDASAVLPADYLIQRFVDDQGLDSEAGEGFLRARMIETATGGVLIFVSAVLLIIQVHLCMNKCRYTHLEGRGFADFCLQCCLSRKYLCLRVSIMQL
jgi:hypothetical protein